jgi:site-specific DNA recombinase
MGSIRVATYRRWSRRDNSKDAAQSLERQRWQTAQVAQQSATDYLEFEDVQSGRRDDRPQFQALLRLIETKQVDMVVIARVDRLTRDGETNHRLAKLFERTGVNIYELLLGRCVDWSNPHDWEYFVNAGTKAEGESRMLAARVKQAFKYLESQGKPGGGGTPFGYCRKDGYFAPNPDEWAAAVALVKAVIECNGSTTKAMQKAHELGWNCTRPGLYSWMRCPTIRGNTNWNERIKFGTHPSLFDEPELLAINALRQIDRIIAEAPSSRGNARSRRPHSLSGLIECGRCGGNCHIKTCIDNRYSEKVYTYVCCADRVSRAGNCGGEYGVFKGQRRSINTPYELAEAKVIEALRAAALATVRRAEEIEPAGIDVEPEEAKALREQIARLEALGDPDLLPVIEAKWQRLREILAAASIVEPTRQRRAEELAQIIQSPDFWDLATIDEKKTLFRNFVERVICDKETVIVKLRV